MNSVGEIGINLVLNSDEFKRDVGKVPGQVNAAADKITSSFGKIGRAVGAAFSVAAITSFVKTVTKSAAQVKAANSQFGQTFGNLSTNAEAAMKKVADESGIVKSRLQGVGTSIYAFAKTTGMDSANALNMMQEALQVTADSATYYDRSLEDTAESLKSFLKGNYANDAALGLSCTETTRNAAANKLYGKSFKDLSEAQKQLTLLQMVKDANAASGALGQAARESDGLENVVGNLKETWNQFLAVVGKPVLKVAVVVIKNITTALGRMIEVAKVAVNELGKVFGWETDKAETGVQETSQAIAESVDNQKALTEETKKTNEEIERGLASFDKLNIISQSKSGDGSNNADILPDYSNSVDLLTEKAEESANNISDKFKNTFKNFYEKSGFKDFIQNVQKGINKVNWNQIGENCKSIFKNSIPIAATYLKEVQKVGKSAFGALGSAVGAFTTISGKSIQTVTGGIAKWLEKDKKKIQNFIKTIGDNFSRGFDNLSISFDKIGTIAGNSIDRMRPVVENAISDLLTGITDLTGGVGEAVSGAFEVFTRKQLEWLNENENEIGLYFDNVQKIYADVISFIGGLFSDIGTSISEWWNNSGGKEAFEKISEAFFNIGTTFMNVWNDWIMPVWDFIVNTATSAWENCLHPIFKKLLEVFGKIGECISTVWINHLSPFINWIVETLKPAVQDALDFIGSIFDDTFSTIGGVVGDIMDSLSGLIDFITGVFSGDWEKAWNGVLSIFKGIINMFIDVINGVWSALYNAFTWVWNHIAANVNSMASVFGVEVNYSMSPSEPPLIPRLAKGGIVTAPTLALVGDNAGANAGNPEVIAPLNKLQGMIKPDNNYDTTLLTSILDYLKRLYELFIAFRNNGGNSYEFTASIDGSVIFREFIKEVNLYKRAHNGALPF